MIMIVTTRVMICIAIIVVVVMTGIVLVLVMVLVTVGDAALGEVQGLGAPAELRGLPPMESEPPTPTW